MVKALDMVPFDKDNGDIGWLGMLLTLSKNLVLVLKSQKTEEGVE